MNLTYETGKAAMIQFAVISLLNIATGVTSVVSTCSSSKTQCVTNMLSSVVFYILIVLWFGFIMLLAIKAQQKRTKRFSQLLILSELGVFAVAGYNIKAGMDYHYGALDLFTSFIDLVFSVWVISLSYRLIRSGGGRVVTKRHIRTNHRVPPL
jgi:hypothetical protein